MANDTMNTTEVNSPEGGKIIFATDVIATIANLAAVDVDGIDSMSANVVEGLTGMLGGKKNYTKGVKIDVAEDIVTADLSVSVKYGYKIHEVCMSLQQAVKNAIETMTGLTVGAVNVSVQSVAFDKPESTREIVRKEKKDDEKAE